MLARGDSAPSASAQDNWQVVWVMPVSVAEGGCEQDHAVFENVRVAFLHVAQLSEQVGVLVHVPATDDLILAQFVFALLMMRNVVVTGTDPFEETEAQIADGIAEHERTDASGIALKRQRD